MKSRLFKIVAGLMLVSMMFAPFSGLPAKANSGGTAVESVKHTLAISETGIYIIRLKDASLAAYQGGIPGLRATSPEVTGVRRLDPSTADSQAYLEYLSGKQGALLRSMATAFGHPVEAVFQYKNVLNAVAVRIDHAEALQAFNMPGVLTVYPDQIRQMDTDVGPILIGAPSIWEGDTLDSTSSKGEGIIIGVIDTGINHAHPSFADPAAKDGYDHTNPYGAGNYVGVCDTDPLYADFCNDKLIGAYDLIDSGGPEDEDGHGSHTASTAGGNVVDVVFDDGAGGTFTVEIRGVAPHANLIAYRVCDADGCWGSGTIAAVDHAIGDMVDVLNYSISGADDPWNNPVDLAFLDAFIAGIFVSASAGNAGPDPATVAKTGPWNASVAGTTHSRILAHLVDINALGGVLLDVGALEGTGPAMTADITAPIIYGGDIDPANFEGCTAWPAGAFTGAIGLVSRGTCSFAIKVDNLAAAGAVGALVFNNLAGSPIVMGGLEATTIPSMMFSLADGQEVVALITGDATAVATMPVAVGFAYNNDWADIMYASSSRGPSQWELLKPDYGAPAVNILAAVAAYGEDPVQYAFYQGTSMAAPHGAGSAALLMALHPDWSPAAVKSAIATTAYEGVVDTDGTPADPFDIGSGRIDLNQAAWAGFVMEETSANYIAANPYLGGEPNTLNQPSMVSYDCLGSCTWTRTITSTMDVAQGWEITFDAPAGVLMSASPESFTLPAGGTQTIEITANTALAAPDAYYFGNVILTPVGNEAVAIAHLPVVIQLGVSNLPDQLDIRTDQLAGTVTLTDLQAVYDITDLWIEIGGLTLGDPHDISLNQDPTNGDGGVYDDLTQVYWTTITVPRETLRFVVEIAASEAPDVDLYVGSGATPSEATELCVSASGIWAEYCNLDFPAKGTYWFLVQNWGGSADQPDAIRAVTAVVVDDEDNLTVTGPETVSALDYFDLDVNWDEPSMVDGDLWYGQFSVGTERREAGNLGYTNVDLEFYEPVYALDLDPATQDGYGDPGVTVSHTLTLTNMGNTTDTFNLTFADNLWVTSLSDTSLTLDGGASADFMVYVTVPADALAGAMDMATITATSVTDPLLSADAVVNSYANAIYDITLTPATDAKSDGPGVVVTYLLTLDNLGNAEDTITVAASGNLWDVNLPVTSFDVPVGGSVDVTVEVTIPLTALNGDFDTVTITATSEGTVTAVSELTTTAVVEQVYYYVTLPVIYKTTLVP